MTHGKAQGDLRASFSDKRAEVELLRTHIQKAELDVQHLRLRLQAAGVEHPSLVPHKLQAGSGAAEAHNFELHSLLQWLVSTVDLSQQVLFECGNNEGEVMVGGRRVVLHRMAAWQLSDGSTTGLRMSVPLDLQAEISGMLLAARRRGGQVDDPQVQRLAQSWELVGAEVVSAAMGQPEPAIFLVHRESAQAIVIAQWPMVEPSPSIVGAGKEAPRFDAITHFARLASSGPVGTSMTNDNDGASVVPAMDRPHVSTGDRVEVEYEGQWFSGVIQWVDGDIANVKCDVDSPGVITVAPLTSVAEPAEHPGNKPRKCSAMCEHGLLAEAAAPVLR
eukprot:CAMPEP_0172720468 /NCGR_PEP_ID=MMETSP1074-20121228/76973_1 /TAXON_ID=2916 /ORGANISM="Ceratium fusus, Strain PA161109" /LENGTH=332 /DNA_ID=CAMNT_0013545991 /DNA_START=117 /DNA_END=1119 /DNA_ORIENTATION=+